MVTLSIYVPYVCSDTIVRAYMDWIEFSTNQESHKENTQDNSHWNDKDNISFKLVVSIQKSMKKNIWVFIVYTNRVMNWFQDFRIRFEVIVAVVNSE